MLGRRAGTASEVILTGIRFRDAEPTGCGRSLRTPSVCPGYRDDAFVGVERADSVSGCTYCHTSHALETLGGDPAMVASELVTHFANEAPDQWTVEQ